MSESEILMDAVKHLKLAVEKMKEVEFDQLGSGYNLETYEETINCLIKGIESYLGLVGELDNLNLIDCGD